MLTINEFIRTICTVHKYWHLWLKNRLQQIYTFLFGLSDEHYVAVFAVYVNKEDFYTETLLAIAPFEFSKDETKEKDIGFAAEHHITFIKKTLLYYYKTVDNVAVLIADNCNTNKSIANKLNVPLN